jgi:hypothetical protein
MMIAAGGAARERRARRLTKDAIIAAGRCLSDGMRQYWLGAAAMKGVR